MGRPLSAVWAASRAGVRRRRVQSASVAVVVALSTATLVFGLGLLSASNSLFSDAFAQARGAHATVTFDAGAVTADQAAATGRASGVTAAAGPFRTAALQPGPGTGPRPIGGDGLLVAGRADPGGPVDKLMITSGRWVRAPGEIVLRGSPEGPVKLGGTIAPPGLPSLKVVGFASSVTGGADGWVTPAQIGALRPDGLQMLYRFDRAGDAAEIRQSLAAATAGLAMRDHASSVETEKAFEEDFNELIPFITVFGALAMAVAVFIIGNVVSGAVVAGVRRIGVLKAIGFTPAQVVGVYLGMIAPPALLGCAAGLVAGHLLAARVAGDLAAGFDLPSAGGTGLALDVLAGGCVLALVALAALVPALRAGRLPAAQAISAGTVSRGGRGRRAQKWLARTRLPVPVGLGLSLPVARPARSALTLAGLCLGVTAVTMGFGLHQTVSMILTADTEGHTSVNVGIDPHRQGSVNLSEERVTALLKAQPGTAHVMSFRPQPVRVDGLPSGLVAETYSGDYRPFLGDSIVRGRWFSGRGELVVTEAFLRLHDMDVGDTLTLQADGTKAAVRIVGSFAHSDTTRLMLDAATFPGVQKGPEPQPFAVIVKPGTDPAAYAERINTVGGAAGLFAEPTEPDLGGRVVFDGLFVLFSLIICTAAALGVLNSVLLNARERSRDLGVLKAVGMAPRQVVLMMVTSMAALGVVAGALGAPLGVLAHHGVVMLTGEMLSSGMAAAWIHVYGWTLLLPPACAGVLVAVLGAWAPAGRAAATRTAAVLRSE
ncbi:ABC transporter permease [Actinomadura sp. NAK00032]|uniref:ABC transporter permease n=1 Tax=Actinomadura sp. NAK00032 TaxID=2742128 RepID=UPI00159142D3|nr:FtsX-like permease family protein [Actinomadura sp. NAK00032]QKW34246.1 ABC transporter permease [Actinomadura sp. NAK00032]